MMNTTRFATYVTLFFITALFINACSSSRPASEGGPADPSEGVEEGMSEEERALQQLLDETRDKLADVSEEQLQIPAVYSKQDTSSGNSISLNPNQGFRIQLLSTRDVKKADTTSAKFNKWISDFFPQYPAKSYVSFKQPYYKVHVGDFRDRNRAIGFTKVVKEKYPGAWIVPDRINPSSIAPDSVDLAPDTTDTSSVVPVFD